jgi:methylthioribose-1-phosphate isomerase
MLHDPHIVGVIGRIRANEFGGSAGMAKAVGASLAAALDADAVSTPEAFRRHLEEAVAALLDVTPSFAPVHGVLHRVMGTVEQQPGADVETLRQSARTAALDAVAWIDGALARIGAIGQGLLRDGDAVFTYSVSGTVWAIVRAARQRGKTVSVRSTESRPHNEGLTHITELAAQGVPLTLGVDAALGQLLSGCAAAMVGADAITATGDALCKIGSLATAVMCRTYGIPFYVTADTSKFQPLTLEGVPPGNTDAAVADIVVGGPWPNVEIYTRVFEVVPARFVTALVTEQGMLHPGAVSALFQRLPRSEAVTRLLRARLAAGEDRLRPVDARG